MLQTNIFRLPIFRKLFCFCWLLPLQVAVSPAALNATNAPSAAADLRLEWAGEGGRGASAGRAGEPLRGREGEPVTVHYRLRNVGGRNAYAAVLESWTALGREGSPRRLQPGPAAGSVQRRHFDLALASGMRELCIEVRLQTLDAGSPGDPNPRDNRICRRVEVQSTPEAPTQPRFHGRTP